MKELELVIHNKTGLHARPAKTFVKLAKRFSSSVQVQYGEQQVNGKSLIGVLKLGVKPSGSIRILLEGNDEDAAADALRAAVESGLGESHQAAPPSANGKPTAPKEALAATSAENVINGIPASSGIAIGTVWHLKDTALTLPTGFTSVSAETDTLDAALAKTTEQLQALREQTAARLSEEEAAIFDAHLEILHDPDLRVRTIAQIEQHNNAATAWAHTTEQEAMSLAAVDNATLAARAADVRDVSQRLLRVMLDVAESSMPTEPFVLLASDLSPSMTASLDKSIVQAICTAQGGPNAHAAILARALGLPAIVGMGDKLINVPESSCVIVDATAGTVTVDPTSAEKEAATARQLAQRERYQQAVAAAGEKATTQDGHYVEIVANVGDVAESVAAYEHGAEGIGLLRSEFLFLGRDTAPSVADQATVYGDILAAQQGQPVIIRTLDVGGDKPLPYIDVPHEDNPFLGERGIRLCLNRPELFTQQLQAIARASRRGTARVMFPMVSGLDELLRAKAMLAEACAAEGVPMPSVGIMVEVPAAALQAATFAEHVDFFSIGTNDLTQYTMAIDRMHPLLTAQADGLTPAVLRLIDLTVQAAHAAGKWVGVCGELGADKQAVPILIGLGVDELSVNVPAIPTVKAQIRSLTLAQAKQLAQQALVSPSAQAVRALTPNEI